MRKNERRINRSSPPAVRGCPHRSRVLPARRGAELLQYAYGICPPRFPLKAHERGALKKYWYLDVLRSEPPNPATISTVNCTTAASYELPRASTTTLLGFEIWLEK